MLATLEEEYTSQVVLVWDPATWECIHTLEVLPDAEIVRGVLPEGKLYIYTTGATLKVQV